MCQIVREMSRCLQYEQDPLWNKKKKFYPLETLRNLNIQLDLILTSSGSSLPEGGISLGYTEPLSCLQLWDRKQCKATQKLEQEGWHCWQGLPGFWGHKRGRAGKGQLEAKMLWKYTSRQAEGPWGDCTWEEKTSCSSEDISTSRFFFFPVFPARIKTLLIFCCSGSKGT